MFNSTKLKYFLFAVVFAVCIFPSILFAQLTVTPTLVKATCPTDSNGSISVVVTGGILPYTYLWSPGGETIASITGQKPGVYGVSIEDSVGVEATYLFLLGPSVITNDTTEKIKQPFCDNNGSIILGLSGGTSPYKYAWNNGSSMVGITQLGTGDYSVLVTDVNSCTATFNFPLTEVTCFVTPEPWFTPNGDGINDLWTIQDAEYFDNARLIIFDRWGTKVYEHKGLYEPWDGKSFLGVPVPDAVYYYFFYQDKEDNQKASRHGSVTVVR